MEACHRATQFLIAELRSTCTFSLLQDPWSSKNQIKSRRFTQNLVWPKNAPCFFLSWSQAESSQRSIIICDLSWSSQIEVYPMINLIYSYCGFIIGFDLSFFGFKVIQIYPNPNHKYHINPYHTYKNCIILIILYHMNPYYTILIH